ncbi:MAG: DUF192 domain-containing protein [Candidatus Omnitrophica bacterium]|nr:DUF192 domain-containing protein [Candidatus Omnitrophota bacterium]
MKIINKTRNIILAEEVIFADNFFKRIKGLLGRDNFSKGQALVIVPCNSVHSFFMRFSIEVIFLDRKNKVIKIISPFKPYRLSGIYLVAHICIEFPLGSIKNSVFLGDTLEFSE